MKDQLEQEIRQRRLYLVRPSRDVSEIQSTLDSMMSPPTKPDIDSILLDQQARKIIDDLVEPQPIGRSMSLITGAFSRSRSPFRGHRALPHSPVSSASSMNN